MRISDWSSDVCSSDLPIDIECLSCLARSRNWRLFSAGYAVGRLGPGRLRRGGSGERSPDMPKVSYAVVGGKIGRASCRERVCRVDLGGRRIIKKKKTMITDIVMSKQIMWR